MAHLGDGLRFVEEACHRIGTYRYPLQNLDRARAFELLVVGTVNDAHGPLADELLDLIGSQPGSGLD